MSAKRLNCWEYMKCGREPGGREALRYGHVCPAATEERLDGLNHGVNGGRLCWCVAGTLCKGVRTGKYAEKIETCRMCDFYRKVLLEEGGDFACAREVLRRLGEEPPGPCGTDDTDDGEGNGGEL